MTPCGNMLRRARPLLGTIVEIGAAGVYSGAAIEAAFREMEEIHRLMSFHEECSDVSRINNAPSGEIVPVDGRTMKVLAAARQFSLLSAGMFDITIGRVLVNTGFLPGRREGRRSGLRCTFRDIVLLPDNCVARRRDACIDLGGIAKGYAVDRAVQRRHQEGIHTGIVNAGGDMFVFGEPQPVHIRHPLNPGEFYPLGKISGKAVASSGGWFAEEDLDGRRLNALVLPSEGRCRRWDMGVTVMASDCMSADALTKIVRLMPDSALSVLARCNAQAIVADSAGLCLINPLDIMAYDAQIQIA